jgi:hypothetical protein
VAGGEGKETALEKAIVATDFSCGPMGFCLTCATAVSRYGAKIHTTHDWLRVRTNSAGLRPRMLIGDGHPKEQSWAMIRKEVCPRHLVSSLDVACLCYAGVLLTCCCAVHAALQFACRGQPATNFSSKTTTPRDASSATSVWRVRVTVVAYNAHWTPPAGTGSPDSYLDLYSLVSPVPVPLLKILEIKWRRRLREPVSGLLNQTGTNPCNGWVRVRVHPVKGECREEGNSSLIL